MQTVFGFFMEAKNVPLVVQEAIAHNRTCILESTTECAIKSVTDEQCLRLKQLGPSGLTAIAYDNLEFDLKVGATSQTNQNTFESIMTSLVFKLEHGVVIDDLRHPLISPLANESPMQHNLNHHITP